jgi:uncharacterized protein with NRDE domain
MCVAALAWQAHPRWKLIVVANRDEYHERPTAPLERWPDGTLAGKDLRAGGTWLGVNEAGRFALVTNHRVEGYPKPDRLSRGALITGWLSGEGLGDTGAMNPFNLLCAAGDELRFISNWPAEDRPLLPGVHGVSNGPFNRPWPKAKRLCSALGDWLEAGESDFTPLFTALADQTARASVDIHQTDPEPRLSGVFIKDPVYGTRCSTVVAIGTDGSGMIEERRFSADGECCGITAIGFGSS